MPVVPACSYGGGRPGAATKSDWHQSLALDRDRPSSGRVFAQRVVNAILLVIAHLVANQTAKVLFMPLAKKSRLRIGTLPLNRCSITWPPAGSKRQSKRHLELASGGGIAHAVHYAELVRYCGCHWGSERRRVQEVEHLHSILQPPPIAVTKGLEE